MQNSVPHCPSCRVPMKVHRFKNHGGEDMELDICWHCQGLWFDTFENLQLSPGSVNELFKQLHAHRDEMQHPVANVMACPRCSRKLDKGYDLVRSGRYMTYRCPEKHGRYSSFSSFMVEKGFVRQMTPAEIADLAKRVGAIYCTGCGAPVDIRKDHACPHCRSAFSLLDPDAVENALKGYHQAEVKRTTRDPVSMADAIVESERTRARADRQRQLEGARDAGGLDVADLLVAGVGLVWKVLTR
jgi:Zn-finger nucleic acid-binding protein